MQILLSSQAYFKRSTVFDTGYLRDKGRKNKMLHERCEVEHNGERIP